jgi:hypothetical protein
VEKPNSFVLQHSWYEQRRVKKGDSKVYVNQESTPYHRAYHRDKLTPAQFEACKVFEKRYLAYWQRSGQRNILDTTVRGSGMDSESQQEASLRAKERLEEVLECMTKGQCEVVFSVAVEHEAIGECDLKRKRYRFLVEGLDEIANKLRLS